MKFKSKVNIGGSVIEFEYEGALNEIDGLPNHAQKIKDSIKLLMQR